MKNFAQYARYYDLFYNDKEYENEVDYVDKLLRKYCRKADPALLDAGCGTGGHDFFFSAKGYRVTGIDKSREMVNLARKKAQAGAGLEFYQGDIASVSLPRKFDVAVSLFHVMSYLTTNELFLRGLKNIHRHLKKGGLFIFDFWYGPAVLTQWPRIRNKKIVAKKLILERQSLPRVNFNEDTVDIKYKIRVLDKRKRGARKVCEQHKMRYFFLPELEFMLGASGFKVLKSLKWLSENDSLTPASWSGVIIAKRAQ